MNRVKIKDGKLERTAVAKVGDDLCLGMKGQSN